MLEKTCCPVSERSAGLRGHCIVCFDVRTTHCLSTSKSKWKGYLSLSLWIGSEVFPSLCNNSHHFRFTVCYLVRSLLSFILYSCWVGRDLKRVVFQPGFGFMWFCCVTYYQHIIIGCILIWQLRSLCPGLQYHLSYNLHWWTRPQADDTHVPHIHTRMLFPLSLPPQG